MTYPLKPAELLARIPAHLHEVPQDSLGGITPALAAHHAEKYSCLACRSGLQDLIDAAASERWNEEREAGAIG